jgi:MinD superfamily P-loop ATPase
MDAVFMRPRNSGRWFKAQRAVGGPLFYAELRPGEENSGKLVTRLKDQARQEAMHEQYPLIISDGPPGIGCAVISALTGVEIVVMVAEPSVSGISDIMRLQKLLKNRSACTLLLINKFDLNPEGTRKLEEWAAGEGIQLLGRIPFKQEVFNAISQGICPVLVPEIKELVEPIWQNLQTILENHKQIYI